MSGEVFRIVGIESEHEYLSGSLFGDDAEIADGINGLYDFVKERIDASTEATDEALRVEVLGERSATIQPTWLK